MDAFALSSEQEILCAQMAELAEIGGYVVDLTSRRCVWCADEVARLLGITIDTARERLSGDRADLHWVHQDHRPAYRAALLAAERDARPYRLVFRLAGPRETGGWLEEIGTVTGDPGERRLVASLCDVTRKRAADEASREARRALEQARALARAAAGEARESSEWLRAAAESLMDGLAIYDDDDRLVFFNQSYPRLAPPAFAREIRLGARFVDMLQRAAAKDDLFDPSMGERFVENRLADRGKIRADQEVLSADGRWLRIRQAAVPGIGRVALTTDTTELHRARQDLLEREDRFRLVAEGVPLPITIASLDPDEPRILFANRLAEEVMGLNAGAGPDRLTRTWVDLADRARLLAGLERHGVVEGLEAALRRRDGSVFWALISARQTTYDGQPAMFAAIVDISEQKAMEQALRASEARFAAFTENAPVGMYIKDLESRYVLLNPEMGNVLRRDHREMLGRTVADSPAGHDVAFIHGKDREVLESGRAIRTEEHTPNPEAYAWDLVIRFPIRDEAGTITHIGGFDVDISDRKAVEEALRTSEQRFRVFAEAHPIPVAISRLDVHEVLFASPPFLELFGVTPADLAEGRLDRYYADPDDRRRIFDQIRRDGAVRQFELAMLRRDGTEFWASFSARLIEYEGAPAAVSGVIDITERKRAEAELERQREAMVQHEKISAMGSLLASVAHELSNPLSVVVGQAGMLEEFAAGTEYAERAGRIRQAADRCSRIVRTFLAMARSRPSERQEVHIDDLILNALELAAYGLRSSGIRVELDLADDLPPLWADGDQLQQILTNLIINGKQALQEADCERRLVIRTWPDGEFLHLSVADNGPGIASDALERVFDPFFTTKPEGIGTGIGLSVSRRLAQAHGGDIEAATGPAGGAMFTLRLPPGRPGQPEPGAALSDATAAPAPAGRVLVIDDEPEIAELLAEILKMDGMEVDLANGGRTGLERIAAGTYDLVISDLRMPDIDGPTLYRRLMGENPDACRRVLFVTGDTLSADIRAFLSSTGVPVIEKPFDPGKIRRLAGARVAEARGGSPDDNARKGRAGIPP